MDTTAFLDRFFALAPWVLFAAIVVAVYLGSRAGKRTRIPIGQTFSCASCGHRAKRDHMVPIAREGSVVWYCPRCASRG